MKKENCKKQKEMKKGSSVVGLLFLFLLIIIDQVTKLVADVYFIDVLGGGDPAQGLAERIVLVPGMIELCISYNRGIAFSAFADADAKVKMAIVFGTAVLMFILLVAYLKTDKRRTWLRAALILIVAGGLGNFIDRTFYQVWNPATDDLIRDGVRDMVYLNVFFDFGVCNFADFFICIGAAVFFISMIFCDTDALIPLGKYRKLAKEADEKAEAKHEAKVAAKAAKKQAKRDAKKAKKQAKIDKKNAKKQAKIDAKNAKREAKAAKKAAKRKK